MGEIDGVRDNASLINEIYKSLRLTEGDVTKDYIEQVLELVVVFNQKQHDYGPGNINAFGEMGVLVRSSDKLARINRLMEKEVERNSEDGSYKELLANKPIEDSWGDLHVYSAIALMVRGGKWPKDNT